MHFTGNINLMIDKRYDPLIFIKHTRARECKSKVAFFTQNVSNGMLIISAQQEQDTT